MKQRRSDSEHGARAEWHSYELFLLRFNFWEVLEKLLSWELFFVFQLFHLISFGCREGGDFLSKMDCSLETAKVGWSLHRKKNLKFKSLRRFCIFAYFVFRFPFALRSCRLFLLLFGEKAIKLRIYGYLWMLSDKRLVREWDPNNMKENLNKNMFKAIWMISKRMWHINTVGFFVAASMRSDYVRAGEKWCVGPKVLHSHPLQATR